MNAHGPFCGKPTAALDLLRNSQGIAVKFRVQCQNCFVATQWRDSGVMAWTDWNTRTETITAQKRTPVNALIGTDMFILENVLHVRNPQTGRCCHRNSEGAYQRMNKADFMRAYSICLKKCSSELQAATEVLS